MALWDLLEDSAQSPDEFHGQMSKLVDQLGFGYYSFLVARLSTPAAGAPTPPFYSASYPDEWRQRYTERNYHFYDPVVVTSAEQRSPFQWGGGRYLRRFRKRQRRVFDEAGPFGIKYGVTIPVHGPQSEFSLLTISVDRNDSHFRDAMEASISDLRLIPRTTSSPVSLSAVNSTPKRN